MFMFSDVLKLLEIHLRNIAEVQTVVFVEVIVQRERCNRALPLRLTWRLPYTGLQSISCLDFGWLMGLIEIGNSLPKPMQDFVALHGTQAMYFCVSI